MAPKKARDRQLDQQVERETIEHALDIQSAIDSMPGEFPVRIDRMLDSLRYAEYDIEGGIGEFVDNSMEGGARNIWVSVSTAKQPFKNKPVEVIDEIAVVDDGCGMPQGVLAKCLVLGETHRPSKGQRGIGRFGVGLTLGAISLGRRVEVYSRQRPTDSFLFTFLDLEAIKTKPHIPVPIAAEPPAPYAKLLANSRGTIVLIKDCDRLRTDPVEKEKGIAASEHIKELATFLGRTYRKFIEKGQKISFNGKPVYLHDPLFELGPTRFDAEAKDQGRPFDLKAKPFGNEEVIKLEIPDQPGQTAEVRIRITLLPKQWRSTKNAGGSQFAIDRKIPDNEGISVLRADREVLYGTVPYIIGPKGQAKTFDIDRWWGCEISFPPELDAYFHVRYIKRGAEPIRSLRDQIRAKISPVIKTLRDQISNDLKSTEENRAKQQGVFDDAEKAMADADRKLPKGIRRADQTPEEAEEALEQVLSEDVRPSADPAERERKKEELQQKPFAIVPVSYPKNDLFEVAHLLGKVIVKLNVAHPFYKDVFEPLCGTIATLNEDSDPDEGADTTAKRLARRALLLMLLSYGKAESFFGEDTEILFTNLRSQWGIALATALSSKS